MDRHSLWILSDNMKRQCMLKFELKRLILRSIKNSRNIPLCRRYQAIYHLSLLPKYTSPNFYVNRCVVSGRVWSTLRRTGSNRFIFRTNVFKSTLPGIRRAS